ncbi:MAG: hypothetical protein AAF514_00055 [Verrucomicrobiota bacterium]
MNFRPIIVVFALTVVVLGLLRVLDMKKISGEAVVSSELYPESPRRIAEPTERPLADLLIEYEGVLRELSPDLHQALDPGLPKEELLQLEQEFSIVLSPDIVTLYSWKNGTESAFVDVFPFNRFVPLEEALQKREHFRNPPNLTPAQKRAWRELRYRSATWG